MPRLIGLLGSLFVRCLKSGRTKSKERLYNNNMNEQAYNNAVEAVKADLIETARDMGLDIEHYKSVILSDDYVKSLHAEIAEMLLQVA